MITVWKSLSKLSLKVTDADNYEYLFSEHSRPYSKSVRFQKMKALIEKYPDMPIQFNYQCMSGAYELFNENQSARIVESGPFITIYRTTDTHTLFSDSEIHTTDIKTYILEHYLNKE